MYYSGLDNKIFLIRLERGERVVLSIKSLCEKLGIKNASFAGIGSIENPVLAHYRVDNKRYKEKNLQGIFEVTNLVGNVAIFEEKPWCTATSTCRTMRCVFLVGIWSRRRWQPH